MPEVLFFMNRLSDNKQARFGAPPDANCAQKERIGLYKMAKRRPGRAAESVAPSNPILSTPQEQTPAETATPASTQSSEVSASASNNQTLAHFIFPAWPTSQPGPWVTPPPPGTRSMSALRPEQVVEAAYNQEGDESSQSSQEGTQTDVEHDVVRKRKKERL
jgi:hypothetical protein